MMHKIYFWQNISAPFYTAKLRLDEIKYNKTKISITNKI